VERVLRVVNIEVAGVDGAAFSRLSGGTEDARGKTSQFVHAFVSGNRVVTIELKLLVAAVPVRDVSEVGGTAFETLEIAIRKAFPESSLGSAPFVRDEGTRCIAAREVSREVHFKMMFADIDLPWDQQHQAVFSYADGVLGVGFLLDAATKYQDVNEIL
jgi:hypothetical protein